MSSTKKSKSAAYTGMFAAIAASSCCIPPVIALIAGVGGSASALSWMEPFRPYLIGLAIIAIGYAWYSYLKPINEDDCGCEIDEKPKWFQTKGFLIGITIFAGLSIAFPYYSNMFYPNTEKQIIVVDKSNIKTTEYKISGMTCASCEAHVNHEVNKLDGIVNSKTSYENGNAIIEFDETKTNVLEIEKAINATGYKVTNKNEIN
ncbi:mercuric transport protein MerTP [Aquimarina sp. M1]